MFTKMSIGSAARGEKNRYPGESVRDQNSLCEEISLVSQL